MSIFWGGFVIGALMGANLAVILMALLAAAKCGECGGHIERWLADKTE